MGSFEDVSSVGEGLVEARCGIDKVVVLGAYDVGREGFEILVDWVGVVAMECNDGRSEGS